MIIIILIMYTYIYTHVVFYCWGQERNGAQERKFMVRARSSNMLSGLHAANKLLTVLLLRVPMCRASVGRHFREDKAGRSSHSKTWIMPYYIMFMHTCHLVRGRISSAYSNVI